MASQTETTITTPVVMAETPAPSAPPTLSLLVDSLALTTRAWSVIKRAGACACCAARLAGCRDPAVYGCNERDLQAQLDARFCPSRHDNKDVHRVATPNEARERCCPLCLGLLQGGVPLRIAPRPPRSAEAHGDHNRACEQAAEAPPSAQKAAAAAAGPDEAQPLPGLPRESEASSISTAAGGMGAADQLSPAAPLSPAKWETDLGNGDTNSRIAGYSRARVVDAVAECIASRGYTVSSFGITAAVPACLALRDAAFLEAGFHLSPPVATASSLPSPPPPATMAASDTPPQHSPSEEPSSFSATTWTPPTTAPPAVVPVKEALKIGLASALQDRLQAGGEIRAAAAAPRAVVEFDLESDFMVEVTAKAPEADAHAMTALLGGQAPSRPDRVKPKGWPGGGKWAKKRQRREEQRNPGLTVGAVKKGLSVLDEKGRDRMRRWVEGLLKEGGGGGMSGLDVTRGEERELGAAAGVVGPGGATGEGRDGAASAAASVVEAGLEQPNRSVDFGSINGVEKRNSSSTGEVDAAIADAAGSSGRAPARKPAANTTTSSPSDTPAAAGAANLPETAPAASDSRSMEALCEIAIRRRPIHFWGRYTKHSRSVPQTPWFRGFYSVQEAVSEPFEEFSGCVEGLLHGAGREDVDVRMLGNGRPFCLELVDSLRSVDEIAARLPSLQAAVNAATGVKNAGGGVAVSSIRVAGPEELPSAVQAVGEGKRKHYRCVVWVSRAVSREEVLEALRGGGEGGGSRDELVVQQSTPIRVLHRRTLLDRPRSIFDMRAEWINEHFFSLELTTSAGEKRSDGER